MKQVSLIALMVLLPAAANAACPQQLAVYAADNGNLLEFTGNSDASMKFHQISIVLDRHEGEPLILDAFTERTHGLGQAEMRIQYGCPDGDIPLDDLDHCTVYQSVIYGADENGQIVELPNSGEKAAQSIVLPNFTADVWMHDAWTDDGTAGLKRPAEVFRLNGCLE